MAEVKSAARGQLGPDFYQRDEDNIDASREPTVASTVICPKCHLQTPILVNGTEVDACFGDMLGNVINACCGHGDPARAYVRIKRLHGNSGSPCVDICGGEVVGYDVWAERQR